MNFLLGRVIFPLILNDNIVAGTRKQTKLGIKSSVIIVTLVTCLPIHNMVVVTSPIGDHAPPALAEIIISPKKSHLSFLSTRNFLVSETIIMDVVRLSRTAEKKNAINPKIHNNLNSTNIYQLYLEK